LFTEFLLYMHFLITKLYVVSAFLALLGPASAKSDVLVELEELELLVTELAISGLHRALIRVVSEFKFWSSKRAVFTLNGGVLLSVMVIFVSFSHALVADFALIVLSRAPHVVESKFANNYLRITDATELSFLFHW